MKVNSTSLPIRLGNTPGVTPDVWNTFTIFGIVELLSECSKFESHWNDSTHTSVNRWGSFDSCCCISVFAGAGPTGVEELKKHTFFATVNWDQLVQKKVVPPFKPVARRVDDAFYFDTQFTSKTPRGCSFTRYSFPVISFFTSCLLVLASVLICCWLQLVHFFLQILRASPRVPLLMSCSVVSAMSLHHY